MSDPIEIAVSSRKWSAAVPQLEHLCRRAAHAALSAPAPSGTPSRKSPRQFCIALADDETVRDLNLRFRGIDKPTNVLSFPTHGPDADWDVEPDTLGDIMVAYETTAAEAKAQGIAVADHLAHLVIHGVLHLRGYDHERSNEAETMETLEADILTRFGIADPYAGATAGHHP